MPLSTKNIIEAVLASTIFGLASYTAVNFFTSEDPSDRFLRISHELLTRAAASESILRASCIPNRIAVTEAYWNLVSPNSAEAYHRGFWIALDEDLQEKTAVEISHELTNSIQHYSGPLDLSGDPEEAYRRASLVSRRLQDNFNPQTLAALPDDHDWVSLRRDMQTAIVDGFSGIQASKAEIFHKPLIYAEGTYRGYPDRITALLASSTALEWRNEGYWWATCNEEVYECMFLAQEKETLRSAEEELGRLNIELRKKNRPATQGMLRDGFVHPILMAEAFAIHLDNRLFQTDPKSVIRPDNLHVNYTDCTKLFFEMFPTDFSEFEVALSDIAKYRDSLENDR